MTLVELVSENDTNYPTTTVDQGSKGCLCLPNGPACDLCLWHGQFSPRWKESVTRSMARDMGLAAVAAHGTWAHGTRHMGTRHTTGTWDTAHGAPRERKQSFIQEDKDASAEWEGAQFYELSYAILFHPKLGFNEGELVEKKGID